MKIDQESLIFWVIISAVSLIGMMLMALALIDARNETRQIQSELFFREMEGIYKTQIPKEWVFPRDRKQRK